MFIGEGHLDAFEHVPAPGTSRFEQTDPRIALTLGWQTGKLGALQRLAGLRRCGQGVVALKSATTC